MSLGLSSLAGSFGFGSSKSSSNQSVWGPQAEVLKELFNNVKGFYGQPNPYLDSALSSGESAIGGMTPYTDSALPVWANFLQGGNFSNFTPNIDPVNYMSGGIGPGFDTYSAMMNPQGNPYLDSMAGSGLNRLFDQYSRITMPAIAEDAAFNGGYGGSRMGVREANAGDSLMKSSADYLTGLYGGQYQNDMSRALQAGQSFNADQLAALGLSANIGGMADTTGTNAISNTPNIMNLGFAAPTYWNTLYGMQWQPYANAAGIYGNPTTLSSSNSDTWQMSMGFPK